jgi:SAM-dependent methyltransferase
VLKEGAKRLLSALVRKKTPIVFGDPNRIAPLSRTFGFDRGSPIGRHYVDSFIAHNHLLIAGDCLEVGETRYLTQHAASVTSKTILAPTEAAVASRSGADGVLIGDLADPATLPHDRFDCFVCTQTLSFIYDFAAAIEGSHRLLRKGGVFLGTVPGLQQISRYDFDRWGDYWRFTTQSMQKALTPVFGSDVKVQCYGNALAAQLILQGIVLEDLPDPAVVDPVDEDYQVIIGFVARKS